MNPTMTDIRNLLEVRDHYVRTARNFYHDLREAEYSHRDALARARAYLENTARMDSLNAESLLHEALRGV